MVELNGKILYVWQLSNQFKVILHQFWVRKISPENSIWNTVVPLLSFSCMFQVEICSQQLEICKSVSMFIVLAIVVETDDCRSWPREEKINNHGCWGKHAHIPDNLSVSCRVNQFFWGNYSCVIHTEYIYFFSINWSVRMRDNLPERVQILGHANIICITTEMTELSAWKYFAICSFERIFNVMQLILVKIKGHIKWKYVIQKFHDN